MLRTTQLTKLHVNNSNTKVCYEMCCLARIWTENVLSFLFLSIVSICPLIDIFSCSVLLS